MEPSDRDARPLDSEERELFDQLASQFAPRRLRPLSPRHAVPFLRGWARTHLTAPMTLVLSALLVVAVAPLTAWSVAAGAATFLVLAALVSWAYPTWVAAIRGLTTDRGERR
jgi:fatty acid desaturase